jgi:hypothetical protein
MGEDIHMVEMMQTSLEWEKGAKAKYDNMIGRIPLFHREIAKIVVDKKAEQNARKRHSPLVEEDDIVSAFFSEVPKAFYGLMVRLLDEVGFRYQEYEHR